MANKSVARDALKRGDNWVAAREIAKLPLHDKATVLLEQAVANRKSRQN